MWAFLRASLRQCHIHKLSKVRKDKASWAKSDEYLTNLMDSDTMLTLENTNDAIKRAENYMQRCGEYLSGVESTDPKQVYSES